MPVSAHPPSRTPGATHRSRPDCSAITTPGSGSVACQFGPSEYQHGRPTGHTFAAWPPAYPDERTTVHRLLVPSHFVDRPASRTQNLWGYIDGRDGAQAVLKALEFDTTGFDRFIIAAADTVMSRSNVELVAEASSEVPVARDLGEYDTLVSVDKPCRVLGYSPQHSWR